MVWNIFYFPIYWECHHPNWLIFFRGVETTNQYFYGHFRAAMLSFQRIQDTQYSYDVFSTVSDEILEEISLVSVEWGWYRILIGLIMEYNKMHIMYIYIYMHNFIYLSIYLILYIYISILPVVPHKAVAEVSKQETYRRGWLLWIMDGRAKPLMDLSIYLSIYLSIFPSIDLSIYLS